MVYRQLLSLKRRKLTSKTRTQAKLKRLNYSQKIVLFSYRKALVNSYSDRLSRIISSRELSYKRTINKNLSSRFYVQWLWASRLLRILTYYYLQTLFQKKA